jgi:hypothetical protein
MPILARNADTLYALTTNNPGDPTMMQKLAIHTLAAALLTAGAMPASAEVLDAVYRGTMVCDKLPFSDGRMREALDVTITGGTANYTHVVRLRKAPEQALEKGTGKVDGQNISLEGAWKAEGREYQAKYGGTFVRRSAKLTGTQSWKDGAKTLTRNCTGVIKRPLRAFLPKAKKTQ